MEWIPLYVNMEGLRVAVLGGGTVAERRALTFSAAGAFVDVYSLDFTPGLREASLKGNLRLHRVDLRGVEPDSILRGYSLVVIATSDPGLNEVFLEEARRMGLLVNYPPDGTRGSVIVPFRGEASYGLRVAVTSLGETGVAARAALERIVGCLEEDRYLRGLYSVMSRVKRYMKESIGDYKLRYRLYFKIAGDPLFGELVGKGLLEEAYQRAVDIIRGETGSR